MEHADPFMAAVMGLMAAAILVCLWRARRGRVPYVRRIAGIDAFEEAVGRSTEMDRPVVFAMGWTDIRDISTHASLSILRHVAGLTARMRARLIVVARPANVYPVAEQVVREAYLAEGAPEDFRPEEQVLFLSAESVVYAMGVARLIEEGPAGAGLFVGSFEFNSLLMAEPGARLGVLQIAADPTLWQVPFFICTCNHVIIGEEYFAAGAYVSPDPTLRATLFSQDLIKLLFAGLIVVGTVLVQFRWGPATRLLEQIMKYAT